MMGSESGDSRPVAEALLKELAGEEPSCGYFS